MSSIKVFWNLKEEGNVISGPYVTIVINNSELENLTEQKNIDKCIDRIVQEEFQRRFTYEWYVDWDEEK